MYQSQSTDFRLRYKEQYKRLSNVYISNLQSFILAVDESILK